MVKKEYEWEDGAELEPHTFCKHRILRSYIFKYLMIRCSIPHQERFRIAIVDGFAGGGRYKCGAAGSPIIFLEEVRNALVQININRTSQGLKPITIESLLILNDIKRPVVEILKRNIAPIEDELLSHAPHLSVRIEYTCGEFEERYPHIRDTIRSLGFTNAIFNLDQCGNSQVMRRTIVDIMHLTTSCEVFYTFSISSLLAFLQKNDKLQLESQLKFLDLAPSELNAFDQPMTDRQRLGSAERIAFGAFKECSAFVSPFSIHNPKGWHYWLIHFANSYRARQVYNDILHDNANSQAHFGRSGLNMLSHFSSNDGQLYLFRSPDREIARAHLISDIPRLIAESGDVLSVSDFYKAIYNETPAHSADIHSALIECPDLEVLTPKQGARRTAGNISERDIIKLSNQKSFFPLLGIPVPRKKTP